MHWYYQVWKKYAVFGGRARRKEYWYFTLFSLIISIGLTITEYQMGFLDRGGQGPLSGLYSLVALIPGLAVTVRRLHDTNRSGWWGLIGLIPCIGSIVLLIYLAEDGQPGGNQYGSDPKADSPWSSGNSFDPTQR